MRPAAIPAQVSGLLDRAVDNPLAPNPWRRGVLLALVWLCYMIGPIVNRWQDGHHLRAIAATAGVAGLAVSIVVLIGLYKQEGDDQLIAPPSPDRRMWLLLVVMAAFVGAEMALLGGAAFPTAMYLAAVAIFVLPFRQAGSVVVATAAGMVILSVLIPSWEIGGVSIVLAALIIAIWLGREIGRRGRRLRVLARQQAAELAIVEDRNRVARDVHDILGHSLTVITVKSELAQRLIDLDPDRAKDELADLERLSREALAGVRETVGGLREMSLSGELATARTALRAADIEADVPADDALPPQAPAVFAWVLREAVTNIVRHSDARHCTVRVSASEIEIADDGTGMGSGIEFGSGLGGLRDRVRAAGGTLALSRPEGGGLRVVATVPASG